MSIRCGLVRPTEGPVRSEEDGCRSDAVSLRPTEGPVLVGEKGVDPMRSGLSLTPVSNFERDPFGLAPESRSVVFPPLQLTRSGASKRSGLTE